MSGYEPGALREELRGLLDGCPSGRPPALRRSLRADYLFATDLPLCAPEDAAPKGGKSKKKK